MYMADKIFGGIWLPWAFTNQERGVRSKLTSGKVALEGSLRRVGNGGRSSGGGVVYVDLRAKENRKRETRGRSCAPTGPLGPAL